MLRKQKNHVAEFYYPLTDNEGQSLAKEHRDFTAVLLELTSGYTDKGVVFGAWQDTDVYRDSLVIYEVAGLTMLQIDGLAKKLKEDARQLSVYLKIDGVAYSYLKGTTVAG